MAIPPRFWSTCVRPCSLREMLMCYGAIKLVWRTGQIFSFEALLQSALLRSSMRQLDTRRLGPSESLAVILEKFIAKELQPWTRTFPYEFYQQIFRLKGWPGPQGAKRPSVIGHYTNDVVYARLAPGVLSELRNKNPVKPSGRRRAMHHQWFTPDIGNPKLKEHLAAVTALMRAAANWSSFQRMLNRAFPKEGQNIPLPLEDE